MKLVVKLFLIIGLFIFIHLLEASEMRIFPQIKEDITYQHIKEVIKIDKDGNIFGKIGANFVLNKGKINNPESPPRISFSPVFQNHYVKLENIKVKKVNICEGDIQSTSYNIEQKCNKYEESIKFNESKEIYNITGDENWSQIRFFLSNISLEKLQNNISYSLYIEYEISDFIVKQGDYYTYFGYDDWTNSGGSTKIILPKNALLHSFPKESFIS